MTTETLRPTSTVLDGGTTVIGAASVHEALSDDSNSSYVVLSAPEHGLVVAVDDLTLPAGSVVKQVRGRALCLGSTGSSGIHLYVNDTVGSSTIVSTETSVGASPIMRNTAWAAWTPGNDQARVNGLALAINATTLYFSPSLFVYEGYIDVVYVTKPVVTLDAISSPITDSSYVDASFTPTLDPDGGPQTHARWWVTDDNTGGYWYDTGVLASSATARRIGPFPSGDYTLHVQCGQTVNGEIFWSDPDTAQFTINVDPPDIDSVVATPDDDNGTITVTVTRDAGSYDWDRILVERTDDGGLTWVPVWGASWADATDDLGEYEIVDFLAPPCAEVTYRATAARLINGEWVIGATAESNATTHCSISDFDDCSPLADCRIWVRYPGGDFGAHVDVAYAGLPQSTEQHRAGSFEILGARDRVGISDVFQSPDGAVSFIVGSATDLEALLEVLRQPAVKFLPPSTFGWTDLGWAMVTSIRRTRGDIIAPRVVEVIEVQYMTIAEPPDPFASSLE